MKKIILLKLGGSIITDKNRPYVFRPEVIKGLAQEIKKSKVEVLIAHGGGSFPHASATKYGGIKGYKSLWGIAKVARDAMEINRLVMDILIGEKIPAVSFRPMSMIVSNNAKPETTYFEPILEALKQGLTPVIYGDVIWDRKYKSAIFSGEYLLHLIALFLMKNKIKVEKIIEVGETDGVYDNSGKTIKLINKTNINIVRKSIRKIRNDVTGGMEHKITEAMEISDLGIQTLIISGLAKNNLYKALLGKKVKATLVENL